MIDAPAEPDPPEIAHILSSFSGVVGFDIGANVGQSALVMASRFETVVSCEPAAESFEFLARTADRLPNVVALQCAVTSRPGDVTLTEQDKHLARGQLTSYDGDDVDGHAWGVVTGHRVVPGRTVDDLAAEFGVPDFIKCDVEGHEVEVFRGAVQTLEATPCLYIEVHNEDLGNRLIGQVWPLYRKRLKIQRHPHYPQGSWGYGNHFWLIAD